MPKIYFKGELQKILKEAGLPSAYKTLRKYEARGIIERPNEGWRTYTQEQIDEIVRRIREHLGK